jgi:hypothetical protein
MVMDYFLEYAPQGAKAGYIIFVYPKAELYSK